jgi:two-component system NtrC family response regulator/two-component system nitrogen regulation response regulator GlnG
MVEVFRQIGQFADSTDPVLIRGETGTGKELVAQAFHTNSRRKDKRFVDLNCTAINENLLESELFGHEPGAFTGADKLRKGKIEYAHGGTLFLDEIGDMPLHLQAKLLRVIEYQEVTRVGSNEPIKVNVRLLSATHRDLEAAVAEGTFRRDLFFRLNRVTLRLPPLRERPDDLPELVGFFLTRAAEQANRRRPAVSAAAMNRLRAHHWPGNIRELQNVVFRAFGVCRGAQILPEHLDFAAGPTDRKAGGDDAAVRAGLRAAVDWAWDAGGPIWERLHDLLEQEVLRAALTRLGGNQTEVADRLGLARGTVIKRIQKYGLK